MIDKPVFRFAIGLAALCAASPALAHGLLLEVQGEGAAVTGIVRYTDGAPGAGEYVRLVGIDDPGFSAATNSDAAGRFRFAAVAGQRYRVLAEGEEGHATEVQFALRPEARPVFIDEDHHSPLEPWWPVLIALAAAVIPLPFVRKRAAGWAS